MIGGGSSSLLGDGSGQLGREGSVSSSLLGSGGSVSSGLLSAGRSVGSGLLGLGSAGGFYGDNLTGG